MLSRTFTVSIKLHYGQKSIIGYFTVHLSVTAMIDYLATYATNKIVPFFFIFIKYIILSCSMYFSSLHCNTTSRRVDSFQWFFITHNSRSKWHYWDKKKSDRLWWASIDFYLQERKKTVIFDAAHEIIIKYLTNWSWEIWPNCLPCYGKSNLRFSYILNCWLTTDTCTIPTYISYVSFS